MYGGPSVFWGSNKSCPILDSETFVLLCTLSSFPLLSSTAAGVSER